MFIFDCFSSSTMRKREEEEEENRLFVRYFRLGREKFVWIFDRNISSNFNSSRFGKRSIRIFLRIRSFLFISRRFSNCFDVKFDFDVQIAQRSFHVKMKAKQRELKNEKIHFSWRIYPEHFSLKIICQWSTGIFDENIRIGKFSMNFYLRFIQMSENHLHPSIIWSYLTQLYQSLFQVDRRTLTMKRKKMSFSSFFFSH